MDHENKVARYEYSDGPPGASKVRIILYVAADIFTAFLSELIFWPIESYATERVERVGTAHYRGTTLVEWSITRGNGELLTYVNSDEAGSDESSQLLVPETSPPSS